MEKRNVKKSTAILYIFLRVSVVASMVTQFIHQNYTNVFLCLLTLVLFMIPSILDKKFKIELPNTLEVLVILFVYSAEILGEIRNYYGAFPNWDTMLHTTNGFLMGAIGFSLIDILNNSKKFHLNLSPIFVSIVAFCFSMTTGVIWEFIEFGLDQTFKMDTQKDWIVDNISSVKLNESGENQVIKITDVNTKIEGNINNENISLEIDGYLDIGLIALVQ